MANKLSAFLNGTSSDATVIEKNASELPIMSKLASDEQQQVLESFMVNRAFANELDTLTKTAEENEEGQGTVATPALSALAQLAQTN